MPQSCLITKLNTMPLWLRLLFTWREVSVAEVRHRVLVELHGLQGVVRDVLRLFHLEVPIHDIVNLLQTSVLNIESQDEESIILEDMMYTTDEC